MSGGPSCCPQCAHDSAWAVDNIYQLSVKMGGDEFPEEPDFQAEVGRIMSDREAAASRITRPMAYGSHLLGVFIIWNDLFFYKDGVWVAGGFA